MQKLHYTGSTIMISDELCEALLNYAAALADAQNSDLVTVPVLDETGNVTDAELLLGPASQLFAVAVPDLAEVDVDPATISDIRERTARLRPSHTTAIASPAEPALDLDMG